MRILTITTLYPNAQALTHGVFVENRLLQLVEAGRLEATVVAPVPWFPFDSRVFGRYGQKARVPTTETRHGLQVSHPRFLVIPKLGMSVAPFLLYLSLRRHVRRALKNGEEFDLIDAHYVYPDGVAAAWLGAALCKPVVLTARGTDLHLIPNYRIPRLLIRSAFRHCAAVVAVSKALADSARVLAGPDLRIEVLRNGVDLDQFREMNREQMRRNLNLTGPTIISVGLLIPRKGHELVIEALSLLPEAQLLICGEGSMLTALERTARRHRVADRVRFLGGIKHEDLNRYYSAADVLVLASYREGWPNVLLEAMACGTPVVATAVGAVPDFVDHPHAGLVVHKRTVPAIASAIRALLENPPTRGQVRAYAAQFSWDDTTQRLLALFSEVIIAADTTSPRKHSGRGGLCRGA
jgi:teichuronic acid biosynthesis glycosyltransferase TuaC